MKLQFDVRIIKHPLENLAVTLIEGAPARFDFSHHAPDRPLQGITI